MSCYSPDSGHVLKVVVGVGDNGETVPVIAEDIEVYNPLISGEKWHL